jgi:hypothetical protein
MTSVPMTYVCHVRISYDVLQLFEFALRGGASRVLDPWWLARFVATASVLAQGLTIDVLRS